LRNRPQGEGARAGRDELAAILEFIRPGDELVVVKLDRLGRSTRSPQPTVSFGFGFGGSDFLAMPSGSDGS
jgi:hypothetical protein